MHDDAQMFPNNPRLREMHERLSQLGASWRKIPLPVGSATRHLESVAARGRVNSHQPEAFAHSAKENDAMQQESIDITTSDTHSRVRTTRRRGLFVAAALVTVMVVLGVALFAIHKNTKSPEVVGYRQLPDNISLVQVDMISPTDGWVIGSEFSPTKLRIIGVVLHYQNGGWITELTTDRAPAMLSMDSANDGWMITQTAPDLTGTQVPSDSSQLYHFHNGSWQEVMLPGSLANEYIPLLGVRVISSNEVWIFGYALILRYYQGVWKQISFPDPSIGVGPVFSAQEAWGMKNIQAVGGKNPVIIYHYVNGEWHPYQLASSGELLVLTMYSSTDGWVVIKTNDSLWTTLHYDGTRWSTIGTLDYINGSIDGFTATGPDECWEAVQLGQSVTDKIVHIQGSQITEVSLPAGIVHLSGYGIERDASGSLWALWETDRSVGNINLEAILTYRNGAWVVWQSQ